MDLRWRLAQIAEGGEGGSSWRGMESEEGLSRQRAGAGQGGCGGLVWTWRVGLTGLISGKKMVGARKQRESTVNHACTIICVARFLTLQYFLMQVGQTITLVFHEPLFLKWDASSKETGSFHLKKRKPAFICFLVPLIATLSQCTLDCAQRGKDFLEKLRSSACTSRSQASLYFHASVEMIS